MNKYSIEKNVQILIAVLKANNIKKVIVSPGTTNISFIVSLVNDGGFEMYSAVDERGAAYMACGLSSESGEPVVITCTGATASRNYYPALTEAYHRKLPILAVTAAQELSRCGNLSPQFIDRTVQPKDCVRLSVQVPIIRNDVEEKDCTLKINQAVLELFRHGGGPVHINLASEYNNDFSVTSLDHVRVIHRYTYGQKFPEIKKNARVAVVIGAHKPCSDELESAIDAFCAAYDGVVLVDHSSHYWGQYRVLPTIVTCQERHRSNCFEIDLLIHIGEEHGDYYTAPSCQRAKEVWRVSEDGELRDAFGKLTNIFEMDESYFFSHYANKAKTTGERHSFRDALRNETEGIYKLIQELPFSNIWIAQKIIPAFPSDACLELGVSNTMRSWTFFDFKQKTYVLANTGCRGIDGAIPTLIGMSLAHPDILHFAVMGDLTFFYSFNVLLNRHAGQNLRVLLINNGCGCEFNLYPHRAYHIYNGDSNRINEFIAAGGHAGCRSRELVKHFADDIGFIYLSASTKEEFNKQIDGFLNDRNIGKSIIFEVFTDVEDENNALKDIRNLVVDTSTTTRMKEKIRNLLGR